MTRSLLALSLSALLFAGCSGEEPAETTVTPPVLDTVQVENEDDIEMEMEVMSSISVDEDGPVSGLAGFPTHWDRISEYKGEMVILEPCDAGNQQMSVWQDGDRYNLTYILGQEAVDYEIKLCKKYTSGGNVNYDFSMQYEDLEEPVQLTVTFNPADDRAVWSWPVTNTEMIFTPLEKANYFPLVKESCRICFDAPCDWEEDFISGYGEGMIMAMFRKSEFTLNFYDGPKGQKINSVTVKDNDIVDREAKDQWFQPFLKFPDYELLHLICIEAEDGWYRVITNEGTGETQWLQLSNDIQYFTWDDYVPLSLAVSRKDQLRNPLKSRPGQNGAIIAYEIENDCFKPIKVVGHWLQVMYQGDLCNIPGEAPFETAWIKWRNLEGPVIDMAWVY